MAATATGSEHTPEALRAELWRMGELRWLLHDDQLRLYDAFKAWKARRHDDETGQYPDIFVVGCSRRWGKDFWCLVIQLEDCLRAHGTVLTYGTAYAKDIAEIVIPLMDDILDTCPEDVRPRFHEASLGEGAGYYFRHNGSRIKLVGVDMHPKALRGRASGGVVLTEAAYIEKLGDTVLSVLYPQLQGQPDATIILQSTAPEFSDGNAFDETFIPDAKLRDAYFERTIEDNPMLSDVDRARFIRASGGPDAPRTRREYYNERVRDHSFAVIPEYDEKVHVAPVPQPPEYADGYTVLDPGSTDLCGIVWAYWYVEPPPEDDVLAKGMITKLMVQRDWAEYNARTGVIAKVVRDTEQELWGSVGWWDGKRVQANPFYRGSDADPRLAGDFQADFNMKLSTVDKDDDLETLLFGLRQAFVARKIQIDPCCKHLRGQLSAGTWNDRRTDFKRSVAHGHLDNMMALAYLWRAVQRGRNPYPPPWFFDRSMVVMPELKRAYQRGAVTALDRALGRNAWNTGRRA